MVSTPLKKISQNGNLPQIGMKIKNIWNHQPVTFCWFARGYSWTIMWYMFVWDVWRRLPPTTAPIAPFLWKPNVDDAVDGHHINWFARLCPSKYVYIYTYIYIGDSFWGLYPLLFSSFRAQFHRPMSCSHLLLAGSLVFAIFCDDAKCRFMRVPW